MIAAIRLSTLTVRTASTLNKPWGLPYSTNHHQLNAAKKVYSTESAFIKSRPRPILTQVAQTKSWSWKASGFSNNIEAFHTTAASVHSPPGNLEPLSKKVKLRPRLPGGWAPPNIPHLRWCFEKFPNEDYGLQPAAGLLICKDRNEWLIECGHWKFFYWNSNTGLIWRIRSPRRLTNVVKKLNEVSPDRPSVAKDLDTSLVTRPHDPASEFAKDCCQKCSELLDDDKDLVDRIERTLHKVNSGRTFLSPGEDIEAEDEHSLRRLGEMMDWGDYDSRISKAIDGPTAY
ncbi:uncharacterized protein KY384_000039 [Bacidia gigantensis]|uniref:uncharacterized protein n=1 Tax=Bacidia gigantensis TaxID=2732470 RepID=UPI001D04F7F7|nr:uncharacterized protein KY384_000039 [Bacidia gigantensis]KAG8526446.1 hypothetical protein KY384_000039 [Bacidia gigantensis]